MHPLAHKKRLTQSLSRVLLALVFFIAPQSLFAANNFNTFVLDVSEGFATAFVIPLNFIIDSAADYTHFTTEVGQTIAQNVTDAAQSSAGLYRGVYAFITTPVIDTTHSIKETFQGEVNTARILAMNANTIYEDTLASFTDTAELVNSRLGRIATNTHNATLAFNPASQAGALLPAVTDTLQSGYNAIYNFWGNVLRTVTPAQEVTPTPSTPTAPLVTPPTTSQVAITPPPTPTTINRTVITQPVIERTIERTRVLSGITATDLASQISALRSELLTEISKGKTQAVSDNNALYLAMAPMNRINNLSSVTISNPTITGASITSGSLSGSFSGSVSGSTGSFDTLGVGTTTPSDTFAVNGVTYLADIAAPAVTTNRLYNNGGNLYWGGSVIGGGGVGSWTLNGSDVTWNGGKVGIGTTSPYATLSVVGTSVLGTITSGAWNGTAITAPYINFGTGLNQVSATNIPTTDTGSYFTGVTANTNAVLQHVGQEINERWSSGVVSGGTIATSTGNTVNIAAGVGYIGTTRVTWNASNGVAMTANGNNWISIDSTGAVRIDNTEPSIDNYIRLGYVYTTAANTIIGLAASTPSLAGNYESRNNNFVTKGIGAIVQSGNIVGTTTTPLNIQATSGIINSNLKEFTVTDASTFTKWYNSADNGWVTDTANNLVNTTQYNIVTNNQATALATMTASYWKKDLILRTLDGNLHYIYGQAQYATEQAAKDGPLPAIPTAITNGGSAYLATAVVQNGDATLANRLYDIRPNLARVFGFGTSGTTGSIASHAALSGLAADDHPQYVLTNGNRLMTGNLQLNTNAITGATAITMAGLLQNTLTTEQMRLRYDASNYTSFTVGSTGALTIGTTGTGTTTLTNGVNVGAGNGYFIGGASAVSGALGSPTSFGFSNTVSGSGIAFGNSNTVSSSGLAFGSSNTSSNSITVALGYGNSATSTQSVAIGATNNSGKVNSVAIGRANSAWGNTAVALGASNIVTATSGGVAVGQGITNTINSSLMIGATDASKLTILGAAGTVGFVGIGTTSPYAALSVVGQVVADYFTATSTTATSTFAGAVGIGTTSPSAMLGIQGRTITSVYNIGGIDETISLSSASFGAGLSVYGNRMLFKSTNPAFPTSGTSIYGNYIGAPTQFCQFCSGSSFYGSYINLEGSSNLGQYGNYVNTNNSAGSAFYANLGGNSATGFTASSTGSYTGNYLELLSGGTNIFKVSGPSGAVYAAGNVGIGTTSPYAKLSVAGTAAITGHSAFGANAGVDDIDPYDFSTQHNTINAKEVFTSTGVDYSNGIYSEAIADTGAGVAPGIFNAVKGIARNLGTSVTSNITGLRGSAMNDSTGTISSAYAMYGNIENNSVGTINSAYGARFAINNFGGGAITNAYGVYVNNLSTFTTNSYGLYLANQGSGATNYSIYTGTTKSYFGGNVGIGTTSPYAALSVAGASGVVANVFNATSTTATSTFTAGVNVGAGNGYFVGGQRAVSGANNDATSFGFSNTVSSSGIAFGNGNTSSNVLTQAFGAANTASGILSFAIGYANYATSSNDLAVGLNNRAGGGSSIAFGVSNNAFAANSIAIGTGITNTTATSLMIGPSDTAKITILSSGNVGVGTTSPYTKLSVVGEVAATNFTATSTTATSTFMGHLTIGNTQASANVNGGYFSGNIVSWLDSAASGINDVEIGLGRADNTTASVGSMIFGGRSRGTLAAPTIVSNGDTLLTLQAVGHDGTNGFSKAANISFVVDGTPGASVMPGKITFNTSPAGSQTPTERLRIDSSGRLVQTGPDGTLTSFAQTISATGVGQTAKGISITGTNLGTISKAYGIEMNLGEVGGGSRWMNLTGTPSQGIVMTNTGAGNPGITLLSGTMNSITSTGTGTGVSMSSTATSSNINLYSASLTGALAQGNFLRFVGGTGSDDKFVVNSTGSIIVSGGLVNPRGTIGSVENLAKYSEQFDQSGTWVNSLAIVTADYEAGPDGVTVAADRIQGTGVAGSITQTISSVATTASRTFTAGLWIKGNTSSFNTTLRMDSSNITGTSTYSSSLVAGWRYVSITQTFPSGSTGSPKVVISTFGTSDATLYGLNFSETTTAIGYTATVNNQASAMRGGTINGRLLITGANYDAGQIIRAGGNQGTTNLLEFQDNTGAVLNVVTASGNVGIGTTSPLATFVTVGSACISKGAGATALCNTTAGTITANAYVTAAADLAERYKTDDTTLEAGEITMLDPNKSLSVMRASKDQDAAIFGVVSTEPGFLLGSYNTLNEASTTVPIALSGRVPVKVTNEGGAIKIGDKITLSSSAGKGMKAASMRAAIGTALENFSGTEGTILAFVNVVGTKLDPAISKGTIGDGQSSFWSIDDSSGRLKYIAALDLNDFDIINVKAIRGSANKWSIDAFGRMVVEELKTNKLCVGETCVDESMLKKILEKVGIGIPSTDPVSVPASTPTPEVPPAPESTPVAPPQTEAPAVDTPPITVDPVVDSTATTTP